MASVAISLALWSEASVSFAVANKGVWKGQYWRFITGTIIHGNVLHLVSSLSLLWILGLPLERRYGRWRMALLYTVLAVGSSAAQYLSGVIGIGMSGVLYGYFGLSLAAGRSVLGPRSRLWPLLVIAMLVLFVLGIAMPVRGAHRVGNVSHVTGLAIGIALGFALRAERPLKWLAAISLVSISLAPATLYMPWSYWWWNYRAEALQRRGEREETLFAIRRAIDLAPCDEAVADLLIYMGRESLGHEAYQEAVHWFSRAMLVTDLAPVEKIEAAAAYYETYRDSEARWLLRHVRPGDLTPAEQSAPFYAWYLDWARSSETQPGDTPDAESQPADDPPPPIDPAIRRLLDPTCKM